MNTTLRFLSAAGLGAAAAVLLGAGPVLAGPPTDQLRQRVDRVLQAVQAGGPDTRARIRAIATEIFDFTEMARRTLGPHWRPLTPAQREEFVALFTDLLEDAYVSRIEQYRGEPIAYVGETIDGDRAVVRSKIVTAQGTEVPIEYRMQQDGDRWEVYDVVIEGVSLVSNYRSQFNRIIRTSSYEDLVQRLRARALAPPEPAGRPRS